MSSNLPVSLQEALIKGHDDIPLFANVLLGMPLHDGQIEFMQNSTAKINVLVPANRWGKTITAAIKHIHANFYKKGVGRGDQQGWAGMEYQTANLAPHSAALTPVHDAIVQIMESRFPIPQEDGSTKNNICQIGWFLEGFRSAHPMVVRFGNNAQVIFASLGEDKGTSIQGQKIGYISYDEGGRSNHLEVELKSNILPRLADYNGTCDIISTPSIDSRSIGYHSDLFEMGQRGDVEESDTGSFSIYSQEGSIAQNKFLLRNNPNYIADMTALYAGDPILGQVLYGKFVFAGGNLFPMDEVKAARDKDLDQGVPYVKGHKYVVGIDTAIGNDECVYTVIDVTEKPFRLVRQMACKGSSKSPDIHVADLTALVESYMDRDAMGIPSTLASNIKIILEAWNGESVHFYMNMPPHIKIRTKIWGSWPGLVSKVDPQATGRRTNPAKKADILIALRKLLANKEIKIPTEPELFKQVSTYRENDKDLKTDRVISLCIAAWGATDGAPKPVVTTTVKW